MLFVTELKHFMLPVEVVYAPLEGDAMHTTHAFHTGMTVADALTASGVFERYAEADKLSVGVFSRVVALDTLLKPGDRVEIYRPLLSDPKEKRRKRVKKA